ncbi:hypothetical protein OO015_13630 (plasmid) [Thermomicrobium sp. 4228-Ro]|uniref:hypothetical protein n=1 Tax=Thermomicrobium sp. 4228-Ro TaxID=2993937 RepID=UPI0022492212|nr:hypothetical protein [Thermomicrobium sp. 4228-Ro]MCX2728526.1 hypothetical protein [Thermomicrobium sp. 4228-Ro]
MFSTVDTRRESTPLSASTQAEAEATTAQGSPTPEISPTVQSDRPVIPGITAADITLNLEKKGFDCDLWLGQVNPQWTCTLQLPGDAGEARVVVHGYSPTRILYIDATVMAWHMSIVDAATPILGYVATLPYEGAEPEKARDWVKQAIAAGGEHTMVIGAVRFRVYGTDFARTLEIEPEEGVPSP